MFWHESGLGRNQTDIFSSQNKVRLQLAYNQLKWTIIKSKKISCDPMALKG